MSDDGVHAVVVSYNTRDATLRCLEALAASSDPALYVTVVDNASRDGSPDAIANQHPSVEVIRLTSNVGYGRAVNKAWAMRPTTYLLILNSDCFVMPETMGSCRMFLDTHPDVVAVACQLRAPDGEVQRSCRAFPTVGGELARVVLPHRLLARLPGVGHYYLGGWRHDSNRPVDQPAGAFLLVRGSAIDGLPFDPRFFMYYEDVDLCRRLWHQGPIWYLASTFAVHLAEHSSSQARAPMAVALARSRFDYFEKWHGRRTARLVSMIGALASLLRASAWTIGGIPPAGRSAALPRARAHLAGARAGLAAATRGRTGPASS